MNNDQSGGVAGERRCIKPRKLKWYVWLAIVAVTCILVWSIGPSDAPKTVVKNPTAGDLVSFVDKAQLKSNAECRHKEITVRLALGYLMTREDLDWISLYCRWNEKNAMPAPVLSYLEANQLSDQRVYLQLKGSEQTSRVQY